VRNDARSGTRGKTPGFSLREDRFETPLNYLRRGLAVDDEEIVILPLQSPDAEKLAAPVRSHRPSI
jgi:hypothetical protein